MHPPKTIPERLEGGAVHTPPVEPQDTPNPPSDPGSETLGEVSSPRIQTSYEPQPKKPRTAQRSQSERPAGVSNGLNSPKASKGPKNAGPGKRHSTGYQPIQPHGSVADQPPSSASTGSPSRKVAKVSTTPGPLQRGAASTRSAPNILSPQVPDTASFESFSHDLGDLIPAGGYVLDDTVSITNLPVPDTPSIPPEDYALFVELEPPPAIPPSVGDASPVVLAGTNQPTTHVPDAPPAESSHDSTIAHDTHRSAPSPGAVSSEEPGGTNQPPALGVDPSPHSLEGTNQPSYCAGAHPSDFENGELYRGSSPSRFTAQQLSPSSSPHQHLFVV